MSGRKAKKNQRLGSSRRGIRGLRVNEENDNEHEDGQNEFSTTTDNQPDVTGSHGQSDYLPSLSIDHQTPGLESSPHAGSLSHKDSEMEAELPERKRKIGSTRKRAGGFKIDRKLEPCDEVITTEELGEEQVPQPNLSAIEEKQTSAREDEQRNYEQTSSWSVPSNLSQHTWGSEEELGATQNTVVMVSQNKENNAIQHQELILKNLTTGFASQESNITNDVAMGQTTQSTVVMATESNLFFQEESEILDQPRPLRSQETPLAITSRPKRKMGSTRRPLGGNKENVDDLQEVSRSMREDVWKAEVTGSGESEFSMLEEMLQTWDDVKRKESPTNTSSHTESAFVSNLSLSSNQAKQPDVSAGTETNNQSVVCSVLDPTKPLPETSSHHRTPLLNTESVFQTDSDKNHQTEDFNAYQKVITASPPTQSDNHALNTDLEKVDNFSDTFQNMPDTRNDTNTSQDSRSEFVELKEEPSINDPKIILTSKQDVQLDELMSNDDESLASPRLLDKSSADVLTEGGFRISDMIKSDISHAEATATDSSLEMSNAAPDIHSLEGEENKTLLESRASGERGNMGSTQSKAVEHKDDHLFLQATERDIEIHSEVEQGKTRPGVEEEQSANETNVSDSSLCSANCNLANLSPVTTHLHNSNSNLNSPLPEDSKLSCDVMGEIVVCSQLNNPTVNNEEPAASFLEAENVAESQEIYMETKEEKDIYDATETSLTCDVTVTEHVVDLKDVTEQDVALQTLATRENESVGNKTGSETDLIEMVDQYKFIDDDMIQTFMQARDNGEDGNTTETDQILNQEPCEVTAQKLESNTFQIQDGPSLDDTEKRLENEVLEDLEFNVPQHHHLSLYTDKESCDIIEAAYVENAEDEMLLKTKPECPAVNSKDDPRERGKEIEDFEETELEKHLTNVNIQNNNSQSDLLTQNPEQNKVLTEEKNFTSVDMILEELQETERAENVFTVTESSLSFVDVVTVDSRESHTVCEQSENISEISEDSQKEEIQAKLNSLVHRRKMGSTRRTLRENKGQMEDREHDESETPTSDSLISEEKETERKQQKETNEENEAGPVEVLNSVFMQSSCSSDLVSEESTAEEISDVTETQTLMKLQEESQEKAGDVESGPVGGDTETHLEIQKEIQVLQSTIVKEEETEENICGVNVLTRQVEFLEDTVTVESKMANESDVFPSKTSHDTNQEVLTTSENIEKISTVTESGLILQDAVTESSPESNTVSEKPEITIIPEDSQGQDSQTKLNPVIQKRKMGSTRRPLRGKKEKSEKGKEEKEGDGVAIENTDPHSETQEQKNLIDHNMIQTVIDARNNEEETTETVRRSVQEQSVNVKFQDSDSQSDLETQNPEQNKVLTEEKNFTSVDMILEELQETERAENVFTVTDSGLSFVDVVTVDSRESHTVCEQSENISEISKDSQKEEIQAKLNPLVHRRKMGSTRRTLRENKGQMEDREHDESETPTSDSLISEEKETERKQERETNEENEAGPVEVLNSVFMQSSCSSDLVSEESTAEEISDVTETQTMMKLHEESQEKAGDVESGPVGGDTETHLEIQKEIQVLQSTIVKEEETEENICGVNVLTRQVEFLEDTVTVESKMANESDVFQNKTSHDTNQEVLTASENVEKISTVTESGLVLQDAVTESSPESNTVFEKPEITIIPEDSQGQDSQTKLNPVIQKRKMGSTRRPLRGNKEKSEKGKEEKEGDGVAIENTDPHSETQEQKNVIDHNMIQTVIDARNNEEETTETVRRSVQEQSVNVKFQNSDSQSDLETQNPEQNKVLTEEKNFTSVDMILEELQETARAENVFTVTDSGLSFEDVVTVDSRKSHTVCEQSENISEISEDSQKEEIQAKLNPLVHRRKMGSTRRTLRGNKGQMGDREHHNESETPTSDSLISEEKETERQQERETCEENEADLVSEESTAEEISDVTETQTLMKLHEESQEKAGDVESEPVGGDTETHLEIQKEIQVLHSTIVKEETVENKMTVESDVLQNKTSYDTNQEALKTSENVENVSTVTESGLILQDAVTESSLESNIVPEKLEISIIPEDSHGENSQSKPNPIVHKRKMGSTRRPLRGNKEKEKDYFKEKDEDGYRKAKEKDTEPHSETQDQNNVEDQNIIQNIMDVGYIEEKTSETVSMLEQELCECPSENKESCREIAFIQELRSSSDIFQTQTGPSKDDADEKLPEVQERPSEFVKDSPVCASHSDLVLSDAVCMEETQMNVSSEPVVKADSPQTENDEIHAVSSRSLQKRKMGSTRKTLGRKRMENEREIEKDKDGETENTPTEDGTTKSAISFTDTGIHHQMLFSLSPHEEGHDVQDNESKTEKQTENPELNEAFVKEQNDPNSNTNPELVKESGGDNITAEVALDLHLGDVKTNTVPYPSDIIIAHKEEVQSNLYPAAQKRKMGSTRKTLGRRRREVESEETNEDGLEERPKHSTTTEEESDRRFDEDTKFKEELETATSKRFSDPEDAVNEVSMNILDLSVVSEENLINSQSNEAHTVALNIADLESTIATDLKGDEKNDHDNSESSRSTEPEKLDTGRGLTEEDESHVIQISDNQSTVSDQLNQALYSDVAKLSYSEKHPQSKTVSTEKRKKMGSTRRNLRGNREETIEKSDNTEPLSSHLQIQFIPKEDQESGINILGEADNQITHDSLDQSESSLLSEIESALSKTSQSLSLGHQLIINEPHSGALANASVETSHLNTPENSSLQVTESQRSQSPSELSSPGRRRKMGSTRKNPRQQLKVKMEVEDDNDEVAEDLEKNKQEVNGLKKDLEDAEESKMHNITDNKENKEYLDVPVALTSSGLLEDNANQVLQEKTSPSTKRKFGSRRTNKGNRGFGGLVSSESKNELEEGEHKPDSSEVQDNLHSDEFTVRDQPIMQPISQYRNTDGRNKESINSAVLDMDATHQENTDASLVSLDQIIRPGQRDKDLKSRISDVDVVQFNVVMVGNSCVGKTSFIRRFHGGQFSPDYCSTIGVDTCTQTVVLEDSVVKLQIWDTAGQERFHSITTQVFHRADGLLLMYDITSCKSFMSVRDWISQVQEKAPDNVIMMLLGNKNDCVDREVQVQEGEAMAREYKINFMECSAATGDNVSKCMKSLAESLVQHKRQKMEKHTVLKKEQRQKKSGCC